MSQWTDEEYEREARAFAKGFLALMLYARTQGITMGFIGPGIAIANMEPGKQPEPDQGKEPEGERQS